MVKTIKGNSSEQDISLDKTYNVFIYYLHITFLLYCEASVEINLQFSNFSI